MKTYQTSSTDFNRRSRVANRAVGSSKDSVGVDQDTTTEVRATVGQADNVGEFTKCSGGSSNNTWCSHLSRSTVVELSSGWESSCQRKDGHRKSESEVENWCHGEGTEVQESYKVD